MWEENVSRRKCTWKLLVQKMETSSLNSTYNHQELKFRWRCQMSTHSNCIWTSPVSTSLSLRVMSWSNFPSFHTILLSSAKQFSLFGWIRLTTVPLFTLSSSILPHCISDSTSTFAHPIESSAENVSSSYTVYICRHAMPCTYMLNITPSVTRTLNEKFVTHL